MYVGSFNEPPELTDTVTFIQVIDPYAEDLTPIPVRTALSQHQHQFQTHQLPELTSQPNDQYADVAATSLKAMIDPSLDQTLGIDLDIKNDLYPITSSDIEAHQFQETIMAALRADEETDMNQHQLQQDHEQTILHELGDTNQIDDQQLDQDFLHESLKALEQAHDQNSNQNDNLDDHQHHDQSPYQEQRINHDPST